MGEGERKRWSERESGGEKKMKGGSDEERERIRERYQ